MAGKKERYISANINNPNDTIVLTHFSSFVCRHHFSPQLPIKTKTRRDSTGKLAFPHAEGDRGKAPLPFPRIRKGHWVGLQMPRVASCGDSPEHRSWSRPGVLREVKVGPQCACADPGETRVTAAQKGKEEGDCYCGCFSTLVLL